MTSRDLIAGLGALLLGLSLYNAARAADVQSLDRIIAIVNDDVVVASELEGELAGIVAQLRQKGARIPPREVLERQLVERLILNKLQMAAAAAAGITVTEETLAQAVNNIARKNGLGLSQFRQALEQNGIDLRQFREGIREQITIQRLRDQQIKRRIRVTDREIEAFLARASSGLDSRSDYHLLHILVSTPEAASPEQTRNARDKAQRLVGEIRQGADFRALAIAESDSRQALEGGDLGWLPANQLPTLFTDTVRGMERGQVSEPIRTPSGYHIILLEDYRGGERVIITQTQARHILIRSNEIVSEDDARVRLQQLKSRIESGDDFATLARSHSDDKTSAINGGDLGWITPGDMLPSFEEEMDQLAPGQISAPFRTDFGWHIVQVLERRQHDSTQAVERSEAYKAIQKRKLSEETELYLRRLRDEAYVELRLDDA
ncbi:MAG: molecular chaperone SurA [Candidatus Sedimenticola endophacoides]|uniref:Chaperone SurA n=1 Tax=Candidatus Sedimenticola endophacoides TaxID=2548426 RepID=A0A6N4DGW3_9GAMM|nr:MAG: molecular chaperone SurA [Candidatus Sedimenticola endophacoides]PUD99119.1 MAG: molecular chaperone SurA [Candidatus Sedimenticola endophacoides]PUE02106.1 MAG: molecular chaperone SurA [Candidatus Sedimenticola endophacoides]